MKRKWLALITALGLAMALAIPVGAVELKEPHKGTECEGGFLRLHFVNNKVTNNYYGTLTAVIDGVTLAAVPADSSKKNKKTQHFTLTMEPGSVLTTATTNLDGMLVLSDYECDEGKKGGGGGGKK
jgi:hypothetical protein